MEKGCNPVIKSSHEMVPLSLLSSLLKRRVKFLSLGYMFMLLRNALKSAITR